MYENNNTVSIDWKGLFVKLIIVAILVFAIFMGYNYFSEKKNGSTVTASTQLFNANLESLRQAGENYFNYSNYPSEGQTVMVTLGELISKGNIKELYDENGNECNRENSYIAVTNDGGQYKLKATLSCGQTSNYTVVTIGCECEGDECTQALKELENKKENNSTNKEDNKNTASNSSNKNNANSSSNNSSNLVNKATKKTTTKKQTTTEEPTTKKTPTTRVIGGGPVYEVPTTTTTTKRTYPTVKTTRKTTKYTTSHTRTYKVRFDTNGGDEIETQYVEKYDTAYEPIEPERKNARFVGWYYEGELWDFDNKITKDITLEAYYWETKTVNKKVYTAGWDTYGTTYMTVTHKLAVPAELQRADVKNVRIKSLTNARTMKYADDLYNHALNHSTTFDGYKYNGSEYQIQYNQNDAYTLANLYDIRVNKTYGYTYDRWVTWSAYVNRQCAVPFDGNKCNYGIVYTVVWEYDIFTR